MSKVDRKAIAYYGRPIDTLSKEELLQAFEELATAIKECAMEGNKCQDIIGVKEKFEFKE